MGYTQLAFVLKKGKKYCFLSTIENFFPERLMSIRPGYTWAITIPEALLLR